MTTVCVIRYHDGSDRVVTHSDQATDVEILEHLAGRGELYKIKEVLICPVKTTYSNVAPITSWIKTTRRLTS